MKRLFRSLFGNKESGSASSGAGEPSSHGDDEIPRYPPFAKGLPAADVNRVLATQKEWVQRINHTLALSAAEFERYVAPVLKNFAAYVHLLPASETHHHRGAGGAFRHGLEVAFWAAQSAEGVIFSYSSSPREKKEQEPRWRLATCLAGLLHDIGKPASDLSVTNQDGTVIWNPYGESLHSWANANKVDRYFLRWRDGRHKRHEQFSVLVVDKIIPPETLQWLTAPGPEILQAMLEAISNTDSNHVVASLVLRADNTSVERDLKSHQIVQTDGSLGVPVEKYLLDAMRRLISNATWLINQKGARVWILNDGPYVVWKQGAEDITRLLAADRVPGIPRDQDTLADILIERNLAIPQQTSSGLYRYWNVEPDALAMEDGRRVRLLMLKLVSNDVLFSTEPPPPAGAVIAPMGDAAPEEPQAEPAQPVASEAVAPATPAAPATTAPAVSARPGSVKDIFSAPQPAHQKPQPVNKPSAKTEQTPAPAKKPRPAVNDDPFATAPAPADELDRLLGGDEKNVDALFDMTKERKSAEKHVTSTQAPSAKPKPAAPVAQADPAWLESVGGEGGDLLRSIAQKLATQPRLWGKAVDVALNRVVIQYPDGAAAFNEPPYVLKQLEDAKVLDLDPTMPMRKVRSWGALKGLVLNDKASTALMALRPAGATTTEQPQEKQSPPASSAAKPSAQPKPTVAERPASPASQPVPQKEKKPAAEKESKESKTAHTATPDSGKQKGEQQKKKEKLSPEKRIEPSQEMLAHAKAFVQSVRDGKSGITNAVTTNEHIVIPLTAVVARARDIKASRWEMFAAIARIEGCRTQNGKLYIGVR
jgi:outer membrane biosynthesis protein TonB